MAASAFASRADVSAVTTAFAATMASVRGNDVETVVSEKIVVHDGEVWQPTDVCDLGSSGWQRKKHRSETEEPEDE